MRRRLPIALVAFVVAAVAVGASGPEPALAETAHEIWIIDQSDSTADGGGTIYIYQSEAMAGPNAARATPEVIDLGGAARSLCLSQTGSAPKRPHML